MKITTETIATLQRFATTMTRNDSDAQDLVGDTLEMACKKKHTFKGKSALETWLYAIMRNVWANTVRKLEDVERLKFEPEDAVDYVSTLYINRDEVRKAEEQINKLPKRQRECLILHVQGYRYEEISERLTISVNTVKTHLKRANKFIRLSPETPENPV